MAKDISPNKVGPRQERRAEHIADNLEKKGVGQDEAKKRALEQALEEDPGSLGGGKNAGAQPQKGNR